MPTDNYESDGKKKEKKKHKEKLKVQRTHVFQSIVL